MKKARVNRMMAIAAILILIVCLHLPVISGVQSNAAEIEAPTETLDAETSPCADIEVAEIDGLLEGFVEKLKAKYGADWETYYNAILAEWGSVEDYLLSLAGERADPAANGWRAFIGGLTETAPIWATALALIIAVTGLLYKRFKDRQILNTVKSFKNTTYKGLNKMQEVLLALGKAQLKQLGCGAATEAERDALIDSMKKLGEVDKDEGS